MKIFIPIVAVIAIASMAALGLSIGTIAGQTPNHNAQLQSEINGLHSQLSTANANSQATQVASLQSDVSWLTDKLHQLQVCVPQLQTEIGGLSLNNTTQGGFLTDVYIQNPTIISQDCQRVIYGH